MTGMVAITMAGFGSRFAQAGYTVPKYCINVLGRPLFDWSMLALSAFREKGWNFSFAVREADESKDFILNRCRALDIPVSYYMGLDKPTDGQATTAYLLAQHAEPQQPFAIFNIDTFVRPSAMAPEQIPPQCDGWVPCFPGPGESWSFVRLNEMGLATELREKQRISAHATVGFYWFRTAQLYLDAYARYFANGGEEKGERYVAPLYNQLIADGCNVRISELALDDVGMLGTPDQVRSFEKNPPASVVNSSLLKKD